MSFLLHQHALNKLCRVCGRINTKAYSSTSSIKNECINYAKELEIVFHQNIWKDDALVHPNKLCRSCERSLMHQRADSRSGPKETSVFDKWDKHTRTGHCPVCATFSKQQRGGRPQKRKRSGKGLSNVNKQHDTIPTGTIPCFNCLTPASSSELVPHNLDILSNSSSEATLFICTICQCILGTPTVQTPCEHHFCAECLLAWFKHCATNTVPCPICNTSVSIDDVNRCPRILRVQLTTLPTVCITCGTIGNLEQMKTHVCSQARPKATSFVCYPTTDPLPCTEPTNNDVTAAARLLKLMASRHIKGTPIPMEIEAAADRWTLHKLRKNPNARLKTPGRVNVSTFMF